jgi:hypothetical protein
MRELPARNDYERTSSEPSRILVKTHDAEQVTTVNGGFQVERRGTAVTIREESRLERQLRLKRESLQLKKEAAFFVLEVIAIIMVSGLSIILLLGNYPWVLKSAAFSLLVFMVRAFIRHLTHLQ